MKKAMKLTAAILMILVAGGWVIYAYARTRPGAVANNGVSDEMPAMPESVQKKMEARWQQNGRPQRGETPPTTEEREQRRQDFEKSLTPEEKTEMEKARAQRQHSMETTRAALNPDEQQRFREKMQERGRGGGGPGGPGGRGGPGGPGGRRGPGGRGQD